MFHKAFKKALIITSLIKNENTLLNKFVSYFINKHLYILKTICYLLKNHKYIYIYTTLRFAITNVSLFC